MIYDTVEQAFQHALNLADAETAPVWIVEFRLEPYGFLVAFDLSFYPIKSFRRVAKVMPKKGKIDE